MEVYTSKIGNQAVKKLEIFKLTQAIFFFFAMIKCQQCTLA